MHRRGLLLPLRSLRLIAASLIALTVVATGVALWALRDDAIKAAQRDADNVGRILAEQISRAVKDADALLKEFNQRAASNGLVSADHLRHAFGGPEFRQEMLDRRTKLPLIDVVAVIDNTGRLVNSSHPRPAGGVDFSDRDYFRHLSANDSSELYVSVPTIGRNTGTRKIFFSRRIEGPAGEFLGVVTVGIKIEYFQRSYDSIRTLATQSFLLLRRDGTVLVRYPDAGDSEGRSLPAHSPWHGVVARGGGYFRSPGSFDQHARLIAARPLPDLPMVANVGVLESAALAGWSTRATFIGLGTLAAVLFSGYLLIALGMRTRDLESAVLHLDTALDNMTQGLCMFDKEQRLLVCNSRYLEMYGLPVEATQPGATLPDLLKLRAGGGTFTWDPIQYAENLKNQIAAGRRNYLTADLSDGRVISVINQPMANGGFVTTHEDITERHRSEARIVHMAHFDALTDLPNRMLVQARMNEVIERLRTLGEAFSVFVFDLDMFKAVNDSLGHPVGDALLKAIASRLQNCTDSRHTVGRIGGDEFAIIQKVTGDQRQDAIGLAETLLQQVCAPYEINGHRIEIGISIGIALAPKDGDDASQLLKNADLALFRAKSDGRKGYRFFEPEMDADARMKRALEIDLRSALKREEFEIHYQLIYDISTREPCGAEALVRWRHPQNGLIGPDHFIPLAEENGLIIPLGEWILRKACMVAMTWPASIKLAVNLSAVQFRSPKLVDIVRESLADSGLPPGRLELEITESVLLQKDVSNVRVLEQLSALGVGVVLDDFGTGYSSLSYLRLYKFSKIKIDKSFIAELPTRDDCAAIVAAATGLARSLDIKTTAEGVETWKQFQLLRAAGCSQAQGFLFSRPRPAAELGFGPARDCSREVA